MLCIYLIDNINSITNASKCIMIPRVSLLPYISTRAKSSFNLIC